MAGTTSLMHESPGTRLVLSIISNYLEHPPGPASRVEPKRSIVVIYHNMSVIADAHLESKVSAS